MTAYTHKDLNWKKSIMYMSLLDIANLNVFMLRKCHLSTFLQNLGEEFLKFILNQVFLKCIRKTFFLEML